MTFEAYVAQSQRALLRFAMVLCADPALAEDLVAESLARAFRQWDRIGALDLPHAYVRRMVVNEFLSWRRRFARLSAHADMTAFDSPQDDHADALAERDALLRRLGALPRKQRAAIVLRFYEGMSDEEIGAELRCRAGTVRSHISRGLAALRLQAEPPYAAQPGSVSGPGIPTTAKEA